MNLLAYLEKDTPLALKIIAAESFDLNRIKSQLTELEKEGVIGYVVLVDFYTMSAHIVPSEMGKSPKKALSMMIGNKYFQGTADMKTEFMTVDSVVDRINRWANHWDKIKSKHVFYPLAVARIQRGFLWTTTNGMTIPREFITEIEEDLPPIK